MIKCTKISVSDPYRIQLNPDSDPAQNLNPDPDPSYFLTLSDKKKLKLFIIIRFSHQKKLTERWNVVKVTKK